jgi:hypothetical protein
MKATTLANTTRNLEPAEPGEQRVNLATRRLSLISEIAPGQAVSRRAAPIWEPLAAEPGRVPTTDEVLARQPGQLAAEIDAEIIALATRPLLPGESHYTGGDNRERELRLAFAKLTPLEAYQVRRRLDIDRGDDALVSAFRRLAVERRTRLKAFLADPRRRVS